MDSLQEFLNTGDVVNIERYLPSILKACQELLEDERTSFNLLNQLLRLLTLISCKFEHCFGPYFMDIVDVLLGWALIPELSVSDRCIITDSFLKFQSQWLINLQFSTSLLSKFMDDMEILIQDSSLEFNQQAGRLFALFSCFSTVLQVIVSGRKETNLVKEISESVENITPRFSRFVLLFLKRFGWSNWMEELWKCLILLAEILQDKFSKFYPITVHILFQCMNQASSQILELMKTNMRFLSLQKSEVLPSSVKTLLQFESPLSQLRLHPNHLVVASSADTYIFLVQHGCDSTITQIVRSLIEELEMIKSMLVNCDPDMMSHKKYTESELLSLIKFDLKLVLYSVSIDSDKSFSNNPGRSERLEILSSFMLEIFNPFEQPIHKNLDLQVNIVRSLHKISESEFFTKLITTTHSCTSNTRGSEFLIKYGNCLIRALDRSSPLEVKLEALNWINTFGKMILQVNKHENLIKSHHVPNKYMTVCNNLLVHILNAAYGREINLRTSVASVLEVLLSAQLLDARDISYVSLIALDKLSDPDTQVKYLYVKLLSVVLPLTIYTYGFFDERDDFFKLRARTVEGNISNKEWKQVLATKHLPCRLQSQQLVSILSFVSQKLNTPLSSWVQRLVSNCRGKREHTPTLYEVVEDDNDNSLQSGDILDKMCPFSNLAAIWWSLHEGSRYCINLRLRTNLGGPTQTFAALERMLLDIPAVLLQDAGQCEEKHLGSHNFHLLPMRLLLEFVESLKKNVYNAYEGSCILHPAPKQSSLFFKANKKVCEEWFSRICEPMMNASLSLHCHDATIHYCVLKLQDLKNIDASTLKEKTNNNLRSKLAIDVLKVLRHASLSLCKRREPESLVGLQKWSATTFSSLFEENNINSWMTGLVYQAQGQFEKAAAYFSHLLQNEEDLSSLGSDGIQFVIARVIESYSSVSDWKSLENWLSELQLLRSIHTGKSYSSALTSFENELNAVHALARGNLGISSTEILAISKGLHDVYSLGKEAASVHSALVDEFSKVNNILLPLESSLSADISALSVALTKDKESNANIPPIHGQALHRSYNIRVKEASHALTSLVPSVIKFVEDLHTMLTMLARSSSMHAGNLHKALEGLGESQEVRSQNLPLSETNCSNDSALYKNQEDSFHDNIGVKIEDLDTDNSYSINDEGWISPPEFTLNSSSDSSITSDDESLNEKSQHGNYLNESDTCDSVTNTDGHENVHVVMRKSELDHCGSMQDLLLPHEIQIANKGNSGSEVIENSKEEDGNEKEKELGTKNDLGSSKMITDQGHNLEDTSSTLEHVSRIIKGQNPYALSVLRQVELKLDGRDIENKSLMNISEQVDYLLKQAMSIDNLCNMYEGWTPWI